MLVANLRYSMRLLWSMDMLPASGCNRIGVLDSGVGGLTVLSPLLDALPEAEFIYYADGAWCPYGPRSVEEVKRRIFFIVQGMRDSGCSMIVVACNTATAAAIEALRLEYDIPFVGMEPAIKPAALGSQTKVIGVLATRGTLMSERFQRQLALYNRHVEIMQVAGDGVVELVEQGVSDTPETRNRVQELVEPLVARGIDFLVLGCTHYPFLMKAFESVLPSSVTVVNPAEAVCRQAVRVFESIREPYAKRVECKGWLLLVSSGDGSGLKCKLESYVGASRLGIAVRGMLSGVSPESLPTAIRSL